MNSLPLRAKRAASGVLVLKTAYYAVFALKEQAPHRYAPRKDAVL